MCELVKAAHKKAMGDFRYMKNLEKWEQAPVLYDIKAFGGKNAVGDFGEYLVDEYYTSQGVDSVVEKGHFAVSELPKVVPNVVLHEGWFEETIPVWKEDHKRHISFMNVDCDLYKSTKTIFTLLNEQIVAGTLIRFDDLLPSPISPYPKWEEGEWKALVEWCEHYNREVVPLARSWKQGCIMKVVK